jgi:branched-chain amino acid transport system permease protein
VGTQRDKSFVVGSLSIRVSGVYFAMITLAFAELFYSAVFKFEFTGGSDGLLGFDALLGVAGAGAPFSESDERAAFVGYDVTRYKRRAFVISGAMAGLAGGLLAVNPDTFVISPDQTLHWIPPRDWLPTSSATSRTSSGTSTTAASPSS